MFSHKEEIVTAIGVLVLVIGAASGSAYVMLGMATAGLVLSAALYWGNTTYRTGLVVLTAAIISFVAGVALSVW